MLVHGANGDLDTFALIEELLAEQHTVWVYSRRGRGGSGDGPDYTYHREVEDVLAVIAATGDRAHLMGHSGGAAYALLAAVQAPSLRSLVLYEFPVLDRLDVDLIVGLVAQMEIAIEADDPDRALELFLPQAGIIDEEVMALRTLEPVWARVRAGARLVPREIRAAPCSPTGLRSSRTPTASVSPSPWAWTRPCSAGWASGVASRGRPRSSTSRPAAFSMSCLVAAVSSRAGGSPNAATRGSRTSAGPRSISPAPTGPCSTRCSPTPPRSPIRSMS